MRESEFKREKEWIEGDVEGVRMRVSKSVGQVPIHNQIIKRPKYLPLISHHVSISCSYLSHAWDS